MDLKQLIVWSFQASIAATVFGFGLHTKVEDLLGLIRRPALLIRSLLAMFVIMPVMAVLLAQTFDFPHTVEVALIALAISPLPPLIPNKLTEHEGRTFHAAALLVTIASLSILIAPLLVELLERYFGQSFAVSPRTIAATVAVAVVPLAAGMACRAFLPALADRIELPISIFGSVLLRLAALALLVISLPAVWALIGNGAIVSIAIFVVAGLAAGHLLGGPDRDARTVLAIATASRHPAVALAIGAANFPGEHFGATILLYLLVGAVVGVPYMIWQRKTARAAEAAAAILAARTKTVDDIQAGRPAPYYIVPPVAPTLAGPAPAAAPPDNGHAGRPKG